MTQAATEQTAKPIGADGIAKVAAASLLGITEKLKDLGYRLEGGDKSWKAYPIDGGDPIGPAASPKALLTQVNLKAGPVEAKGNGKTVDVGKSTLADGEFKPADQRLPTMEEPEIDELNAQADLCIDAFEKKKAATTAAKDQDDIMRQKMRDHKRKRYSRRGWSIVIEDSEKLVIKKVTSKPAKNPRTAKGKAATGV